MARALLEYVLAGVRVVKLGGRDVERQENLFARLIAGVLDGLQDDFDGRFGAIQLRGETAFVSHCGGKALFLEHRFKGVKSFGNRLQAFGKRVETLGHDHELLKINRRVGMSPSVDDVGHGHGEHFGVGSSQIFE